MKITVRSFLPGQTSGEIIEWGAIDRVVTMHRLGYRKQPSSVIELRNTRAVYFNRVLHAVNNKNEILTTYELAANSSEFKVQHPRNCNCPEYQCYRGVKVCEMGED